MPKDKDIKKVLLIGSGPINIGQACEFDYSGVQACRALREDGCEIILVNSNPATIMTDPEMADKTYIEPLDPEILKRIIKKEKPDTVLPTMGGQTALNLAITLYDFFLEQNIKIIGANRDSINKAEDRELFAVAMKKIGLKTPEAKVASTMEEALAIGKEMGFPAIVRPSFTLGGSGGGIAYNQEEFISICHRGFQASPTHRLQVDKSLLGWKEYELEVVRDKNDNCIIVCSIENLDPMGIHTGDSITVAPVQTLTDKEYQKMRDSSIAVLREIGVDTGGANVQFAVDPDSGEQVVVEMNPRVSRSSALASKATGFPIARVATKLALGYTLDELRNEITGGAIPSSFEPTIDYVVTKIPRFDFKKFRKVDDRLTTQMKSIGEVMGVGRNFCESLQKSLCSLETGLCGLNPILAEVLSPEDKVKQMEVLRRELKSAGPNRILYLADAMRAGLSLDDIYNLSKVDLWFLAQIKMIVDMEQVIASSSLRSIDALDLKSYKRMGFSDERLAQLLNTSEDKVRAKRHKLKLRPVYKKIDSCAGEYASPTSYLYSTYDEECEAQPTDNDKVIIIGSGPNRIGQGIEFDYCCVHVSQAASAANRETIMINCNPETVSTDFDTSDKLYFEPLTYEHTLEIINKENNPPVLVQYGGQTPLKLAGPLSRSGIELLGTSSETINRAEDREEFRKILVALKLKQPKNVIVKNIKQALNKAADIGYPLVVRPSFVLGGQAMQTVFNDEELSYYLTQALDDIGDNPILLDRYLDKAIEVDVDAVSDGEDTYVGGIMQHIEEAGIHSGDSSCSIPAYSLSKKITDELARQTRILAAELKVRGLLNIQFAVKGNDIYVLEINPRASRTAPFISKIIGKSLPRIATQVALGSQLKDLLSKKELASYTPNHSFFAVKEAVFPFTKFPGYDPILGPEMKSTGEVMGIGKTFEEAFYKASLASGMDLNQLQKSIKNKAPLNAFISVRDADKEHILPLAQRLIKLGFAIWATSGTAKHLSKNKISHHTINKFYEGSPHIIDKILNQDIDIIINSSEGRTAIADSASIRTEALRLNICYTTTISSANSLLLALEKGKITDVYSLQEIHATAKHKS
ncbi:MAG: carbamoyl-phosphate synthase large subunit [Gammaproteobacteria bacterium]|nr:carbamoyl-phosphate synthase large subunit [Gammaproteobacteria bacterium]